MTEIIKTIRVKPGTTIEIERILPDGKSQIVQIKGVREVAVIPEKRIAFGYLTEANQPKVDDCC